MPSPERRRPLFDGLPNYQELDKDTDSLIPYAELLRDIMYRRLYPDGDVDLIAPSTEAVFDRALHTAMERMIMDKLDALAPAEFAQAYRSVNGDEALAAALDQLAEQRRQDVVRQTQLARMQRESRISGRLKLGELNVGEVLTLGLFDPGRPDLAARRFRDNQQVRPLHRILQVRLLDPEDGEVEVVHDTWTGAPWSQHLRSPLAKPLSRGLLGTRSAIDHNDPIRPELTIHAPVVLQLNNDVELCPPQILGYAESLDRTVLLDAF